MSTILLWIGVILIVAVIAWLMTRIATYEIQRTPKPILAATR